MNPAERELLTLLKEQAALNADLQAQLNAQRIVIKALIAAHEAPQVLHARLRDAMDEGADALRPQRVADTAEFVDEYVQVLLRKIAPLREGPPSPG